ncbi:MAG: putative aminopeptidase [Acidobacteria bacterium]|nr:putative aminopeptidase [Acidobacteriota bacterium]
MRSNVLAMIILATAVTAAGCGGSNPPPSPAAAKTPAETFAEIDGSAVLEHTRRLADDSFEGRAPGSRGEDFTVAYIADEFRKAGLQPGNTDGHYIQKVPLVGITPNQDATLAFRRASKESRLRFKDDFVAWSKHVSETAELQDSEIVFVGYGVQAPEFSWDDYKGSDLKGKTLVMLVGDPPVPDPADPGKLDPKVFGGPAMTYYGRWTYKYEIGAKMGAAGVLIVHETEPAGYPFSVVQNKVTEQFDLVAGDRNMSRVAIEGWISLDQARRLFTLAGNNYDDMKKQSVSRSFRPVPLGVTASITLANKLRMIESCNVVGKLEGSDQDLKSQYVIYTSHWDHLGIEPDPKGAKIYHGAQDNATGIGGLIELARAFGRVAPPPKRTMLFLAVTAEEQGLLGSQYYAENPIYPLARTLAVINMDVLNVYGRTRDITIVGLGNSDLDDYAQKIVAEQGRVIRPDPSPEKGSYYRSDHFPFAKMGVPALASSSGIEFVGKPEDYGRKIREEYTSHIYHQPSDVVQPDWDMSGTVLDLQFYGLMGYRAAQADKYPEWKTGTEFRAVREAQLKAAGIR